MRSARARLAVIGSLAVIAMGVLASCARGPGMLYGAYAAYGPALDPVKPPATLEMFAPDRYRFCQAGHCSNGRFTLLAVPASANGRITFHGAAVESFARDLAQAEYGPDPVARQRGVQGSVDLDYSVGLVGAEIKLGAGDAAFVKR